MPKCSIVICDREATHSGFLAAKHNVERTRMDAAYCDEHTATQRTNLPKDLTLQLTRIEKTT